MEISTQEIAYEEAHSHEDRGQSMIAACTIFLVLALATVAARVVTRKLNRVRLGLDDWLALSAMSHGIALYVLTVILQRHGIGRHIITIPPERLVRLLKVSFAYEVVWPPCIALTKLSILALIKRIFTTENRQFALALYLIAFYVVLWFIALELVIILQCRPIHSYWSLTNTCQPEFITSILTSVFETLSDIAIMILPQPLLWRLQMPLRQKLLVASLFVLGLFACIVSIARIPLLKGDNTGSGSDVTYVGVDGYIFTTLLPLVGITCACLPVSQNLFRKLHDRGFSLTSLRSLLGSRNTSSLEASSKEQYPRESWRQINSMENQSFGSGNLQTHGSKLEPRDCHTIVQNYPLQNLRKDGPPRDTVNEI